MSKSVGRVGAGDELVGKKAKCRSFVQRRLVVELSEEGTLEGEKPIPLGVDHACLSLVSHGPELARPSILTGEHHPPPPRRPLPGLSSTCCCLQACRVALETLSSSP